MGLAPLNTPLHAKPRSRRPANAGYNASPIPLPGPSQPRRLMSPTPEETTSPRTAENASAFSPMHRSLSSPVDMGDNLVEDVLDDASDEELDDETILIGHEIWSALGHRPEQERSGLGWRGWLGVAAFGLISGSVILLAGNQRKETQTTKPSASYYLQDRGYH